ncbi:PQQ-binding-like beta-propeller repeat protein [Streptomyces sp. NBC_00201]|uniref:serine/threonine-protein kinase n=1 Tax=unclassified Streptomyces TaxID=2593676 RepID=UPI00224EDB77|nr:MULTISPECIES: serine/threonine-protein kinase [unclassified Streptomyces]MCX5059397.1 PQQ-binding-like beta-propeller repeat protein [Streptomyces sp. NBC_00452]MCX5243958.1 PQQ-binding-like beta-propeller repeat protein [Streptomyces sp. NBC_00201]MCX5290308.1 PQQ-binding-like beta-propeller repeat protein [Streptomyces sp. NBC_00183]
MTLGEEDPRSVGGYRIESRIGIGGMGVVYLGRSASGRTVAVKVVHTRYADNAEFRARFRQEIAAARQVSGAFTAPVVDADPDADRPWMATAYVPGHTLAERVAQTGALDWPALRRLGTELAEALREIHRAQVVHRDLKPSNVLLLEGEGDNGAVRVIDFGISRAASSDVRTQTGLVMGSPPFMAPEQFSRPREVGPAVDVFSLGAVLVYAATGRSPFEAENAYLAAYNTVHSEPDLGELPKPLRPLVSACLAKEPADRPTSGEVLDALAALPEEVPGQEADAEPARVTSAPVRGTVPRPSERTERTEWVERVEPERRRRTKLWAAVAVAALLGVAGASAAAVIGGAPASTAGGVGRADTRTASRGSVPPGWKPWRNALEMDKGDPMAMSQACAPDALGVFCSSARTALIRLSATTGRTAWTKPMSKKRVSSFSVSRPAVHDGVVHVRSADRSEGVDTFDARTGRRLWRLDGPVGEFSYLSGVLLVRLDKLGPSGSPRYAAYEARTGQELWQRELTSRSPSPFYEGPERTLYADLRSDSGRIARLDARTGRTLSTVKAPTGVLWLATVHDGTAYYARWEKDTGESAAFFIQDLSSGKTRRIDFPWSVEPEAPPLVHGDTMYIFDYGNETLLALDLKRGKPLWTSSRELRVFSEPSLHDGRLYVNLPDTSILALDPRTGREIGRTTPSFDTEGRSFEELTPSSEPPLLVGTVLYGISGPGIFSVADVH